MSERSNVSPESSMSPLQQAINDRFKGRKHHKWHELSPLINAESVHTSYAPPGHNKVSVLNAFSKNEEIASRLRAMGARSMLSAYTLRDAIYKGNVEEARRIIYEEYPDLTYKGTSGISTLSQAIQYTPVIVIDLINTGNLGVGSNDDYMTAANKYRTIALMSAIRTKKTDDALKLMEEGITIDAKFDEDGATPLMTATANNMDDVVLALIKKGASIETAATFANAKGDDYYTKFNDNLIRILRSNDTNHTGLLQLEAANKLIYDKKNKNLGSSASKSTNGGSKKRRSHRRRKTRKPRNHYTRR